MTPVLSDDLAARYRRGRLLTLVVVVGTAAMFLWQALEGNLLRLGHGEMHIGGLEELLGALAIDILKRCLGFALSVLLIFLFCRYAFRGGRTSTGCLAFLYLMGLPWIALGLLLLPLSLTPWTSFGAEMHMGGFVFKDVGRSWVGTASFILYSLWTSFACWVLIWSPNARFYRETRQRGILRAGLPAPLRPPSPS